MKRRVSDKRSGPAISISDLLDVRPVTRGPLDPCPLARCHLRRCRDAECSDHRCRCMVVEDGETRWGS